MHCTAATLENPNIAPPPPRWEHSCTRYPLQYSTIFVPSKVPFLPRKNDIGYGWWPMDPSHVNEAFCQIISGQYRKLTSHHILFLDSNLGYASRISRFSLCTEDWQKRDHLFWRLLRCTISITETRYLYIYCIPIELVLITKIGKSYT
jgi:hypothetical protein